MTSEYNVVGEHKDDDQHLLVLGDDGQHYDYSLITERIEPVQVDDSWRVDDQPLDPAVGAEAMDIDPEVDD